MLVLVTAILALILYGRTLTPGLLTGDGGEFQTLATLLAPAAILFVVATSVARKTAKAVSTNLKTAVLGAFTGLAITIIIFLLLDWHNPAANYFNSVIEPSRSAWNLAAEAVAGPFERLVFGWSARQFRPFMFANMGGVMPQQAADYWHNLPTELAWPLIVLAAVGAIYLLIRQWRTVVLLLPALFTQLFYFFNYEIWDLYVFYIPSYVILVLLAVAGMGGVADGGRKLLQREKAGWLLDVGIAAAVFIFAIYPTFQPQQEAVVAGTVPFAFDEYPVYSESLLPIARATVLDLPDNSIVFTDWDMMWPYYYAAVVENGRTDLTFIETYPADEQEAIADSVLGYIAAHIADQPIYFTEREPALQEAGYQFSPARMGPTRLVKIRKEDLQETK